MKLNIKPQKLWRSLRDRHSFWLCFFSIIDIPLLRWHLAKSKRTKAGFDYNLEGYEVRIVDGNHIGGTEHRLKLLREEAAGVLDPQKELVVDVFPLEDAHALNLTLISTNFALTALYSD